MLDHLGSGQRPQPRRRAIFHAPRQSDQETRGEEIPGAGGIDQTVTLAPPVFFTLTERKLIGCLLGSSNGRRDIPRLLELYTQGQLDLDGLVTRTYPLEGINDGYADMNAGKNIRGVLVYD